ncbi:MAG: ATP synthase F0 sector subunit a, partial [uncultured Blastococcus sp.]
DDRGLGRRGVRPAERAGLLAAAGGGRRLRHHPHDGRHGAGHHRPRRRHDAGHPPARGRPRTRAVPAGGRVRPGPQLGRPGRHRVGALQAVHPAAADAVHADPGEQPDGHRPARPVPDDEPDRLPARPRARGLRRLPGGRRPASRPCRFPQEPGARWAAVLGRAGRVRPRAGDVPGHPSGDADAAALRQHVRRPHPAAAVRPRRGVPAAVGRGPAQARRDPGVPDVLPVQRVRDPDRVPAGLRLHPARLGVHRRGLRGRAL